MDSCSYFLLLFINICLLLGSSYSEDPSFSYEFEVSYITASPLGVPQQVLFFRFTLFCIESVDIIAFSDMGLLIAYLRVMGWI